MTAILVVDDDELFARSLARDLVSKGYEATTRFAVDEAWKVLERSFFDIVLTDLRMQPHSGLELVRAVRRAYPDTGPVLMSGCAGVRDYQQAIAAGSVAVLVKPFSDIELREAIEQALALRTGLRGSVHGLTLTDMLQMFHLGRRTLQIEVSGHSQGCVRMRDGEVIDVVSDDGNLTGMLALRHLLSHETGMVNTSPLPSDIEDTIETPFDFLLMEAIRENDESGMPSSVHKVEPVHWDASPAAEGNAALAPRLSPVRGRGPTPKSMARTAPQILALERAVTVATGWLDAVEDSRPLPASYIAAAICCSSAELRILSGRSMAAECAEHVIALVQQLDTLVDGRSGFLEHVRGNVGVAVGWNLGSDTALLLVAPVDAPTEGAKFRARTSVFRRVVTAGH